MSTLQEKIKSGEIKMTPRWHFVVQSVAFTVIGLVLFFGLLSVTSFLLFLFRVHGVYVLPLLLGLVIAGIVVLELFAHRFSMSYRRPLVYSLITIAVIVVLGIFLIDTLRAHEALEERAVHGNLPAFGRVYRHYHRLHPPGFSPVPGHEIYPNPSL